MPSLSVFLLAVGLFAVLLAAPGQPLEAARDLVAPASDLASRLVADTDAAAGGAERPSASG